MAPDETASHHASSSGSVDLIIRADSRSSHVISYLKIFLKISLEFELSFL